VEERIAMATPAPIDASEAITQLEAKETLALEDLDAEEEAALEQSSQNVADRYAEQIQVQTDIVKRRDLEARARSWR
jgi:hypothetical protein